MVRIIAPIKVHDACIFCGGSPTTKEHVFPKWSHRYIQKQKGKFERLVGATDLTHDREVILKGRGDIHDLQVKCVCGPCNNGWMRELENKVRPIIAPIIQGQDVTLRMQDRRTVAGWAVLKSMIVDQELAGFQTWSRAALSRMRDHQLPPLGSCWVWLARYARGDGLLYWSSYPMAHFPKARQRSRFGKTTTEFNSATTTQVLGDLFVHIIHTPMKGIVEKFAFRPPTGEKLRLIWPPSAQHVRRPLDTIGDVEADYVQGALVAAIDRRLRALLGGNPLQPFG